MLVGAVLISDHEDLMAAGKYFSFQKTSDIHILILDFSRCQLMYTDALPIIPLPFLNVSYLLDTVLQ